MFLTWRVEMKSINPIRATLQSTELGAPSLQRGSNFSSAPVTRDIAKDAPPTDVELQRVIEQSNSALKQIASSLEFSQDLSTGKTLIRVYDRTTSELIRQFPSEEMIAIAKGIDSFKGLLINQKA
jgi:flagellar protein FlaG